MTESAPPDRGSQGPAPIRRRALSDDVFEALKEHVIDQHVPPGGRLIVDQLAADFDVSPTPVREALMKLEGEGLVTKTAMRGFTVAPMLDESGFRKLYEMRLLIEPEAAALAAARISRDALTALHATIDELSDSEGGFKYREFARLAAADAAFHEGIARATDNPLILDTVTRMRSHVQLARLYVRRGTPDAERTLPEHEAIIAALEAGDSELARQAMTDHLLRSQRSLRGLFTAPTAEAGSADADVVPLDGDE